MNVIFTGAKTSNIEIGTNAPRHERNETGAAQYAQPSPFAGRGQPRLATRKSISSRPTGGNEENTPTAIAGSASERSLFVGSPAGCAAGAQTSTTGPTQQVQRVFHKGGGGQRWRGSTSSMAQQPSQSVRHVEIAEALRISATT